jgi:hypothetical protein
VLHLKADAIGTLEQHRIISGSKLRTLFCAMNDLRSDFLYEVRNRIDVLARRQK